jgi:RNA polymerase sigma-70 factor (ECF subfamily)
MSEAFDNQAEFVSLLTGIQPALHAFLTSLMPGDPAVDDLLQQTNLVLWQKRDVFRQGTNFHAWAFSVARWEVKAWTTRRKRTGWLLFSDELSERIAERFEEIAASQPSEHHALDSLQYCLARLKESDRELVLSHHQHGKSLYECSKLFGRNANSLKVTLFRLRQALRRCMDARESLHRVRP